MPRLFFFFGRFGVNCFINSLTSVVRILRKLSSICLKVDHKFIAQLVRSIV